MNKEKLAIVSSYDELCGNASYTKALKKELSNYFEVSVIGLDVALLRRGKSARATQHIENIKEQLSTFDCVNVQLEAGLFGSSPATITKNFFSIAKACKKLVVTMHRYHPKDPYPGIIALGQSLLRSPLKGFVKQIKHVYASNRYVPFYHKVIRFCMKHEIPIIVHTKRDKKLLEMEFKYNKIFDHPLCFYSQDEINCIKTKCSKSDFYKELNLDDTKKYIGIFGFINSYKGHETAIKSLIYLPDNYELLICGSQHPHTIKCEETINSYINELLKIIDILKLSTRVKFYRLSSDEDFVKALLHCDYNVLPYLEVTQGGSAIAALSLESNSRAVFSQNLAFFELEKYATDSFKMFSIGNYMELATAILSYEQSKYADNLSKYHEKYSIQTSGLLYRKLLKRAYQNVHVQDEKLVLKNEVVN